MGDHGGLGVLCHCTHCCVGAKHQCAIPVWRCGAGEEQTQQTAAAPATDAQVLAAEFPDIDAGLIEAMLEDQGGDAADVRFALRVRRPAFTKLP